MQLVCGAFTGRQHLPSVPYSWKLSWFLQDFNYDAELLGRDELDQRALAKLRGVVKLTHTTTVNGTSLLNFDGFAPAARWEELSSSEAGSNSKVA